MHAQDLKQLFIPPIYYKIKNRLRMRNQPIGDPLPMRERKGDKMIIIGNGPSLNKSLEKYKDVICNTECIAVNFFASTDMFKVVRPAVYLLNDNAFFDIPENLKSSVDKLLTNIVDNTNWEMTVVLPCTEKKAKLIEILSHNPYIKIIYFNYVIKQITDITKRNKAWDNNSIAPPEATVLNVAVWLSLYWGYPETYLIGADTSWIEDLKVDQDTNQLYTIDRHFYNNSDVYNEKNLINSDEHKRILPNSIYEELRSITACFKNYEDLENYAKWKGLKVYNASEYSLIDAFERKKID